MSALAVPAATPPPAPAAEGGRAKRKAKIPERFQSPPPAKRQRPNPAPGGASRPPLATKRGANGSDAPGKSKAAPAAAAPPRPPRAPTSKSASQKHKNQRRAATSKPGAAAPNAAALAAASLAGLKPWERARPDVRGAADVGVNAVALAALSSPGAAAILGQSPVSASAARDAEIAAKHRRENPPSPLEFALAGLEVLLEASEASPFAKDLSRIADAAGGRRADAAAHSYAAPARSNPAPVRPEVKPPAAARDRNRTAKEKKEKAPPAAAASKGSKKGDATDAPNKNGGGGAKKKPARARAAAPADPTAAPRADAARASAAAPEPAARADPGAPAAPEPAAASSSFQSGGSSAYVSDAAALARAAREVASRAPGAVLAHALRWLDLVVADLKGRSAALRRSRRRIQKMRAEVETGGEGARGAAAAEKTPAPRGAPVPVASAAARLAPPDLSVGDFLASAPAETEPVETEASLLAELDATLAAESKAADAMLKRATALREASAAADEGDKDAAAGTTRGADAAAGAPPTKRRACDVAALLGGTDPFPAYANVTRAEASVGASASVVAGEEEEPRALALARAFLETGLRAAEGERREGHTAAACPAKLIPAPHVL